MEACLAVLLREEEMAAPAVADAVLLVRPVTLFEVADVLANMRGRLAVLDVPAELSTFARSIPVTVPDRPFAWRYTLSGTLLAALELGRTGEAVLLQDNECGPVLVGAAQHA